MRMVSAGYAGKNFCYCVSLETVWKVNAAWWCRLHRMLEVYETQEHLPQAPSTLNRQVKYWGRKQ